MKVKILEVSKMYVTKYLYFLNNTTDIIDVSDAYLLFSWSMKKLLGLETSEYSNSIQVYGSSCIDELSKIDVLSIKKLTLEERVHIVSGCEAYFVALGFKKVGEVVKNEN